MAKKDRPTPARASECGSCGAKANAIPGSRHRRCGGSAGANLKDRHDKLDSSKRGTWS